MPGPGPYGNKRPRPKRPKRPGRLDVGKYGHGRYYPEEDEIDSIGGHNFRPKANVRALALKMMKKKRKA